MTECSPIAQLIHFGARSSYRLSDAAFLKVVLWFRKAFFGGRQTFVIGVTRSLVVWDQISILDWCVDGIGMMHSNCLAAFSVSPLSLIQRRLFSSLYWTEAWRETVEIVNNRRDSCRLACFCSKCCSVENVFFYVYLFLNFRLTAYSQFVSASHLTKEQIR